MPYDDLPVPQNGHVPQRESRKLWPHTRHLPRIRAEGRNRPPPSAGSPTLVWHLGIWRKHNHARGHAGGMGAAPDGKSPVRDERFYAKDYQEKNKAFFKEVSDLLVRLQQLGLCEGQPVRGLDLKKIVVEGVLTNDEVDKADADGEHPYRFRTYAPQSASFELWWRDGAKNGALNTRLSPSDKDAPHALRVFVQFQSFQDHITLTFYIDAGKRFTGKQLLAPGGSDFGVRRGEIARHLDKIRSSSHEQIVTGAVEMPADTDFKDAELKAAADYLFEGIWADFQLAFDFGNYAGGVVGNDLPGEGVIFVNLRGLMMSIRGLETRDDKRRRSAIERLAELNGIKLPNEQKEDLPWRPRGRAASATLGPVDVFDHGSGEPEVVVKSLWPFLCEMTAEAASKDWVGCGILEWRALLMSTLGAMAPSAADDGGKAKADIRVQTPERFLMVTKGEPHRKQIGRIVERLVALETMRAIAFKNLGAIQNAELHLRSLTMELDDILQDWSKDRHGIENDRKDGTPRRRLGRRLPLPNARQIEAEEIFYAKLSELNATYEKRLIGIAASLEKVGPGGSGHLAESIDEATYYTDEFDRMVPTLEIGNVAGWTNYSQFADRGMRPTFNLIKKAGRRLGAAQERLKSLTDVVQVSALIVQADATRRNTETLRRIAYNLTLLRYGGLALVLWSLSRTKIGREMLAELLQFALEFANSLQSFVAIILRMLGRALGL